ncbi:MAG: sigma-70 family RNA polymerase sigma factor [Chloroflexota bacterium]
MDQELRRQAVDRAYRDHAQDVYRVAFAILRESEAAVDATHDTFARAFERWEQYDANRPLRGWLHGIVTHAALDALRRRRVRQLAMPVLGRIGELDLSGTGRGGDPAIEVVRRRIVDEGLARLRPDARAAIVLRHYYGYDYAEIAGFLRTSPGNVGSILSRAHAVLRELLSADGIAPTPSSATARTNGVSSETTTPGRATNGR